MWDPGLSTMMVEGTGRGIAKTALLACNSDLGDESVKTGEGERDFPRVFGKRIERKKFKTLIMRRTY